MYNGVNNDRKIEKALVGRKILGVQIDAVSQEFFRFDTDEGAVVLKAHGECCSQTWFADLINASDLVGYVITSVEFVDLPPPSKADKRSRSEVDEIYGLKIFTTRGIHAYLIFRNSSNGYYGGWVNLATPAQWAKVKWTPVTEDMSW